MVTGRYYVFEGAAVIEEGIRGASCFCRCVANVRTRWETSLEKALMTLLSVGMGRGV